MTKNEKEKQIKLEVGTAASYAMTKSACNLEVQKKLLSKEIAFLKSCISESEECEARDLGVGAYRPIKKVEGKSDKFVAYAEARRITADINGDIRRAIVCVLEKKKRSVMAIVDEIKNKQDAEETGQQ